MSYEEFLESGLGETREEYEEWLEYYNNSRRSEETGWYYPD